MTLRSRQAAAAAKTEWARGKAGLNPGRQFQSTFVSDFGPSGYGVRLRLLDFGIHVELARKTGRILQKTLNSNLHWIGIPGGN